MTPTNCRTERAPLAAVRRLSVGPVSGQTRFRRLAGLLFSRLPTSLIGVALFRFALPPGAVTRRGSRGDCPARNSNARLAIPTGPRRDEVAAW